jgi:hypothetical protein
MNPSFAYPLVAFAAALTTALPAAADENLLGYVAGAETLPEGASDAYFFVTRRWDKGRGDYTAHNYTLEYEHGLTHRLTGGIELKGQSIDASGLVIDGYMPGPEDYGVKASGIEGKLKYNFLSPAKDAIGLSGTFSLQQNWRDPHSGKDKDVTKFELGLQLQKLLIDDQLSLMLNTGLEGTYAKRAALDAATQAAADSEIQALTEDPPRPSNGRPSRKWNSSSSSARARRTGSRPTGMWAPKPSMKPSSRPKSGRNAGRCSAARRCITEASNGGRRSPTSTSSRAAVSNTSTRPTPTCT